MKTTKWFKTGEPVPDGAKYIMTKDREVGSKKDFDGMCDVDVPVYAEFHLYEIPLDPT